MPSDQHKNNDAIYKALTIAYNYNSGVLQRVGEDEWIFRLKKIASAMLMVVCAVACLYVDVTTSMFVFALVLMVSSYTLVGERNNLATQVEEEKATLKGGKPFKAEWYKLILATKLTTWCFTTWFFSIFNYFRLYVFFSLYARVYGYVKRTAIAQIKAEIEDEHDHDHVDVSDDEISRELSRSWFMDDVWDMSEAYINRCLTILNTISEGKPDISLSEILVGSLLLSYACFNLLALSVSIYPFFVFMSETSLLFQSYRYLGMATILISSVLQALAPSPAFFRAYSFPIRGGKVKIAEPGFNYVGTSGYCFPGTEAGGDIGNDDDGNVTFNDITCDFVPVKHG